MMATLSQPKTENATLIDYSINAPVTYKDVTWCKEGLKSSKQACIIILKDYGFNAVKRLEKEGLFGNLDV